MRKPQPGQRHRNTGPFRRRLESVRSRCVILLICVCMLSCASASASPVAVRYKEGLLHGFLVLSTLDGTPIAEGDLIQVPEGNRITSRLIFHFKYGSQSEETTIFSQRGYFRLIRYYLVQKC